MELPAAVATGDKVAADLAMEMEVVSAVGDGVSKAVEAWMAKVWTVMLALPVKR